ncbi:hypothetical protein EXS65_00410 [Candidatus Peribacteria bacterium]|nr:hypothetical protein [Candidatus Peribacteria bacterium]
MSILSIHAYTIENFGAYEDAKSVIFDFTPVVLRIAQRYDIDTVRIFGSFARGEQKNKERSSHLLAGYSLSHRADHRVHKRRGGGNLPVLRETIDAMLKESRD